MEQAQRQLEQAEALAAEKDAALIALQREMETLQADFIKVSDRLADTEAALTEREAEHETRLVYSQEQMRVATAQAEEAVEKGGLSC